MKVELNHMFSKASGKLCKKEGMYVAYNKQTGKMYQAVYHERSYPNTEKQQAVKTAFAQRAAAAKKWWTENKPSDSLPDGSEDYKLVMSAYKKQYKIGNPYSYALSLLSEDLVMQIPGKTEASGGSGSGSQGGTPGGSTTPVPGGEGGGDQYS